jgi:hypothetical protein
MLMSAFFTLSRDSSSPGREFIIANQIKTLYCIPRLLRNNGTGQFRHARPRNQQMFSGRKIVTTVLLDLLKTVAERAWSAVVGRRRLSLLVHQAYFAATGKACYFLNVTNLSADRELEITHVWFDLEPQVHAVVHDRPLPKRLKPEETWETWVEAERLPTDLGKKLFTLGRARLSSGGIVKSSKNRNVPSQGAVPGGPIQKIPGSN